MKVSSGVSTNYYFFNRLGQTVCSRQATGTNPGFDFRYTNSPQGEWKSIVYPSGRTINNSLDDIGRVTSVADASSYATGIAYSAHGAVGQLQFGNGLFERSEYNGLLQKTEVKLGLSAGSSELWRLQNGFDKTSGCAFGLTLCNNGNVMAQTVTIQGGALPFGSNYWYDGVNRLQLASEAGASTTGCPANASHWCEKYGYDNRGNRLIAERDGTGFSPAEATSYGANNRVATAGYSSTTCAGTWRGCQ